MTREESRAAQVGVLTDPQTVRLLSLIMNSTTGSMTWQALRSSDPAAPEQVHRLVRVGLLLEDSDELRPSHDALVRFGSLLNVTQSPVPNVGDHERALASIITRLTMKFAGVLAPETVREFVEASYDLLASRATVRRFLPQLTDRFADDRLEALASLERPSTRVPDDVLFVCVRNAGRSQIAAALMRQRLGGAVRVRTAGSAPAVRLDPQVRLELQRRGIDALTEFPRPLTPEVVRASGVVVTMGCGDACPVVPGRRYLDWNVDDPVGRSPHEVRLIVDDIAARVSVLIAELGTSGATGSPTP